MVDGCDRAPGRTRSRDDLVPELQADLEQILADRVGDDRKRLGEMNGIELIRSRTFSR
jgi:hypothetical protein